jgi:LL-diaminopimelate aminotransferase
MQINTNFLQLQESYLFSTVAGKVKDYQAANPDKTIYRLGIGDVTLPLVPVVVEAMQKAVAEMGDQKTFRGYGEEQGYGFCGTRFVRIMRKRALCWTAARSLSATERKAIWAIFLPLLRR